MKNDTLPETTINQTPSSNQLTPNVVQAIPTAPTPPVNHKNKLLLIITVVVLLVILGGGSYYLGAKVTKTNLNPNKQQSQESVTNTQTPVTTTNHTSTTTTIQTPTTTPIQIPTATASQTPTKTVAKASLFSGKLKRLSQNLQLFKLTEYDKQNSTDNDFIYYEAGKFNWGELKGYTRIIAIRRPYGPGQTEGFILATKDYQTYILDDPGSKTTKYPEDNWQNPYNYLDKSKIVSTRVFETEQPEEIDLDQNFALYIEKFSLDDVPTNLKDKNGNPIYDMPLTTNFSSYQKLTSPFDNLTIYFRPYGQSSAPNNQLSQAEKEELQLRQKYILGNTNVTVVDSVGLPIIYSMATTENVKAYNDKYTQYQIALNNYQDQLKKFHNKEISQAPKYPQSSGYISLPNLGFNSSQINSQNNLKFFNSYETAIPGFCATLQDSRVFNMDENELEQIGSVSNIPLYRLKDANHPLYKLAYDNKMKRYNKDPDYDDWDSINEGMQKPTLEEYVSQNPLLFIKNHWQQWVALGEFDIELPGGCGKPVVYLYPTKPTDVSVEFQAPVQFTTDIPKYADFWQVKAYPDGSLVNLKPQFTDCQQIDTKKRGSEYAKQACQSNIYPYLYWAGNISSVDYPTINKGWIVKQKEVNSFLNEKLTEMGLNYKERKDFMSYWLADILEKDAPYYRISFLQTNDLNRLFPMRVSPQPDTTFRIFLDYTALAQKPQQLPQPQSLNKLVRNGFTLVEWGGLKKL